MYRSVCFFCSTIHVLLTMQLSAYHNASSLRFPSVDYSEQAIDFSAPASQQHPQDDDDDVLDLRIRPRDERIVKDECYDLSCPCMTVNPDHPSASVLHHYVPCTHAPSHTDAANTYAQAPNTVLQPSQSSSPSLFSHAFVLPTSSVSSVPPTAAPSTSRESLEIPLCPQYTFYHHRPSTEDTKNLQLASSSDNNFSDTASIPTLSPTPPVGIQLPTFQLSSSENNFLHFSVVENQAKKHARPFKAISFKFKHARTVHDENYRLYRQQMLEHIKAEKRSSENKKIHPSTKHSSSCSQSPSSSPSSEVTPQNAKDAAYLEKRRKNNAAAKRSRDARRAKEDELAIRTAYLERENTVLKCLLAQCTHCSFQMLNSKCVNM